MPTRTKATEATEANPLTTFVVVTDAVTVSSGQRSHTGRMTTVRLVRGERLQAPERHPSVLELLSMHSIAREDTLTEDMRALLKRGNAKRPHVLGKDDRGHYRVTAAGVVGSLSGESDPALQPVEAILPVDAGVLDTSPTVVE